MISYKGQSAESNINCNNSTGGNNSKLDLRFADDEDAEDIEICVGLCYGCEYSPDSPFYNRSSPSIKVVTKEQVCLDLATQSTRWVVLETPYPEEQVVCCARLILQTPAQGGDVTATVDLMAYPEDSSISSRRAQLLVHLERIVSSQNIGTLTICVSQWRTDVQEWLESCGYSEMAGALSEESNLRKPTMTFHFIKSLKEEAQRAREAAAAATSLLTSDDKSTNLVDNTDSVFSLEAGVATLDLDADFIEIPGLRELNRQTNGTNSSSFIADSRTTEPDFVAFTSVPREMSDEDRRVHGPLVGAIGDLFSALNKEQENAK